MPAITNPLANGELYMEQENYEICSAWENDVLRISISGTLGEPMMAGAKRIGQNVAELFDEHAPDKVLIDCTNLTGRLGVAETYFHLREYRPGAHLPSKVAVLDLPENRALFSFQETTGMNAGLFAKYFGNLAEALQWLHG